MSRDDVDSKTIKLKCSFVELFMEVDSTIKQFYSKITVTCSEHDIELVELFYITYYVATYLQRTIHLVTAFKNYNDVIKFNYP